MKAKIGSSAWALTFSNMKYQYKDFADMSTQDIIYYKISRPYSKVDARILIVFDSLASEVIKELLT